MVEGTKAVEVHYFAAAEAATGIRSEVVHVTARADLRELRTVLVDRHGPDLARILGVAGFLVSAGGDDGDFTRDLSTKVGARVDVMPPFAGG
ncbi:MoaD/ThiS family protein [Gordonia paraffinivorans]|uniref:MoaD/ThiS family protein n=1 Tax=Gordonia paraffinivorans TaxID=175628 RepID=UPI000D61D676|nr:MoaD/ThiS family protein [Gordonia paraffinivorans]PWD43174.1 molybdopterin synthase sulfur carrier subunit [Gordonia paraffinivorans]